MKVLKSVEKYICAAHKLTYVSKLNIERCKHSACITQGKIFVVGGKDANYFSVKEIECYNPSTDRWEIVARNADEHVFDQIFVV